MPSFCNLFNDTTVKAFVNKLLLKYSLATFEFVIELEALVSTNIFKLYSGKVINRNFGCVINV